MSYRLEPRRSVPQSVKRIAASQIEDLLAQHGKGAASPVAVHEARKALKRLRALLSLVREGVEADDLQRERLRLRDIAGSLAGARDAHVMIETAIALQNGTMQRSCQATAETVMTLLEGRRDKAEATLAADAGRLPIDAFEDARRALEALPLDDVGFEQVLGGFAKTYHRGRKRYFEASQNGADDEGFHDLRKDVQQHWRHLQLLCNAWPKVMRPQIALARELGEALGKHHDLSVLAAFVRDNAGTLGQGKGIDAYLRLCAKVQGKLRAHTEPLARRLYAEKPKAIAERIRVYWETAKALGNAKTADAGNAKTLTLSG
jgi:CHAD domain-containing protein